MDKSGIYMALTALKALIIIVGMIFVLLNFASWLSAKDGDKLRKAALVFAGVFLSVILLSGIELIIALN